MTEQELNKATMIVKKLKKRLELARKLYAECDETVSQIAKSAKLQYGDGRNVVVPISETEEVIIKSSDGWSRSKMRLFTASWRAKKK